MTEYRKCAVCGEPTIEYGYDYCPYCGWSDDIVALDDPNEDLGGPNHMPLAEARQMVAEGKNMYNGGPLPWLPEEYQRMMDEQKK